MPPQPLRVLVVEDSADDAELMLLELRRAGYAPSAERVETAAAFRAALAAREWDVILCDNAMPELDAQGALGLLRESGRDVPLVIVSGTIGEERAVALMRAGATDFVMKGTLARLPAAVEREVRQAAERRERRRAEGEARGLAAIVASSDDAIIGKALDGTITSWNAGAERLFGYAAPEIVGRNVALLVSPDHPGEGVGLLGRVSRGERVEHYETERVRKDGTRVPVSISLSPVRDAAGRVAGASAIARDITGQKRQQAALRASEERYRTLVDATAAIVWNSPATGAFDSEQPGWTAFTGQTVEQHRGWGWLDAVHPDDREKSARAWEAAVAARTVYQVEHRLRRADGDYRHMAVRAVPILDPGGAIREWVGVHTDVTEQRQAQADRDAALARLNLQIERMPLAYMTTDADFRCTRWNPAAERTFGFTEAEVLGKHPFEILVPPPAHPHVADLLGRLRAGDMDAHGTNENVTKDGRAIVCEWHNTPLLGAGGAFEGHIALAQDVTARKVAEHALLLRDRAIRAVVGGILITDATAPDNPISYVSPGFEHLTGYTGAEAVGRNCRFLQGRDTDPAAVAEVREAVRRGVPCDVELLNYLKDGTPFWNALSISPVRDDAGRLTNFIGVQTDVTGRRKLENQFHQAQKMEAVGQLAGGVAHDFNNLLTVINGYGEIVHGALPPDHPSRELVAEIMSAGERAAGLTRQLLAFSRQAVLEPKVLDPNALVRDVERMLRRLIGEDIDLATRLAPDLGRVKADPGQLEQAVVNLCVNARDAMPTGGKLTVETRNIELDAAYVATHPDVRPGPYVVVAVSDTGTGMTPEVQARIFEPFFTTKELGKGTGLGLAMVFGFVKQSGGHIGVHSEPGRGTTFKLYLPRAGDAPLAGKAGAPRTPMPRGTETVLLVEDEDAVRALGRHILVMCGYTVLVAGNGREAVRAAEGHAGPIHLLVTDVVMPGGMGGRQVAEAVVARHPEARVLFTSGYTDDAVVRHGVLDAGTHFLQKPFTPATLARKVRDVLDGTGDAEAP
ncbi:PAS domain S-box protein [Gemmata sp.]|uniref:hybrid sensor histidine kinase/response regulator n=1 Tax=Gemmata sp. TaxID=1914242 RepID=UPI003F72E399